MRCGTRTKVMMLVTMTPHLLETIFFQERTLVFSWSICGEHGSCAGIPVLHSHEVPCAYQKHFSGNSTRTAISSAGPEDQSFGAIASSASSIKIPKTLSLPCDMFSLR